MPVNYVDIGILAIILLSAVFGMYEGFLLSVIQSVGSLVSWLAAAVFYRPLAAHIAANTKIVDTLMYYSAGSAHVSDVVASNADVATLAADKLSSLVASANLPEPLGALVTQNVIGRVFASRGVHTLSDYLNETFVAFMLNALCFMAIFVGCVIVVAVISNLVSSAAKLPVLRQLDGLAGGAFGALRGVLIVAVLFLLYPIAITILPLKEVTTLVEGSQFAAWFYQGSLIIKSIAGSI